jgi:hypothetical protein
MITYKLELRVSLDTPEQENAMVESIKMGAKHMLTTASLISPPGRPPEIAIVADHFFMGKNIIELADDIE